MHAVSTNDIGLLPVATIFSIAAVCRPPVVPRWSLVPPAWEDAEGQNDAAASMAGGRDTHLAKGPERMVAVVTTILSNPPFLILRHRFVFLFTITAS